jgi:hypothetical protein
LTPEAHQNSSADLLYDTDMFYLQPAVQRENVIPNRYEGMSAEKSIELQIDLSMLWSRI